MGNGGQGPDALYDFTFLMVATPYFSLALNNANKKVKKQKQIEQKQKGDLSQIIDNSQNKKTQNKKQKKNGGEKTKSIPSIGKHCS